MTREEFEFWEKAYLSAATGAFKNWKNCTIFSDHSLKEWKKKRVKVLDEIDTSNHSCVWKLNNNLYHLGCHPTLTQRGTYFSYCFKCGGKIVYE